MHGQDTHMLLLKNRPSLGASAIPAPVHIHNQRAIFTVFGYPKIEDHLKISATSFVATIAHSGK